MDLDHERRLTEVEERAKSNSHRIDEIERRQDNLDELVGTERKIFSRLYAGRTAKKLYKLYEYKK